MIELIDPCLGQGNFDHPWWCNRRYCGMSNPVPCHMSTPRRISGDRAGGIVITMQLSCVIDEPLELAPVSIELVMRDPVTGKAGRFLLDKEVASPFHASLGELLPITS
ncbi:hypothetical protein [Virgisporangium aliadipatigenens]|nr:hypothetical protein [Virgisporangium aliadipatigenens]